MITKSSKSDGDVNQSPALNPFRSGIPPPPGSSVARPRAGVSTSDSAVTWRARVLSRAHARVPWPRRRRPRRPACPPRV